MGGRGDDLGRRCSRRPGGLPASAAAAGGWVRVYSNAGSYDNRRTMIKAFVEYAFDGGYAAQAGYRLAEFKESVLGFNNYRAGIFEISFGYRWQQTRSRSARPLQARRGRSSAVEVERASDVTFSFLPTRYAFENLPLVIDLTLTPT